MCSDMPTSMNRIVGIYLEVDAVSFWNTTNYRIDDYWLNEKLEELYPGKGYRGFAPALVYWITKENEKNLIWKNILPDEHQTSICPIYVDTEFLGFHGTLIVAEIKNCGETIQWKRLGVVRLPSGKAEEFEAFARWFEAPIDLTFSKTDYLNMLDVFRERLEVDKQRIEEFLSRGNQESS